MNNDELAGMVMQALRDQRPDWRLLKNGAQSLTLDGQSQTIDLTALTYPIRTRSNVVTMAACFYSTAPGSRIQICSGPLGTAVPVWYVKPGYGMSAPEALGVPQPPFFVPVVAGYSRGYITVPDPYDDPIRIHTPECMAVLPKELKYRSQETVEGDVCKLLLLNDYYLDLESLEECWPLFGT